MVQPRDEQQAVQEPVDERADRARRQQPLADRVDRVLHRLPYVAEHDPEHDAREPRDDRHEALAAEEREVVGQLDVLVAVVQQPRDDARDDPGQHAHVQLRIDVLHDRDFDQIADRARERRHAVVVLREADRDADREQQRQVLEDRAARVGDHLDVEHVLLPEAQQDARHRQHRDRQHQRPAEALYFQKRISVHSILQSFIVSRR
ncbi:PTS system, N-acetylglucosamine-specific IIBC component domain protein [Burkholderia pseudomallei]|nr:PTS system, N-acetylglucosamine-specific IIBC component domain protein [Burkholderia pseudomallei]KGD43746.1 PTS system, N-acetylglucosamine-specific IIBC component domain protein [Burkholderia pseudomallei]